MQVKKAEQRKFSLKILIKSTKLVYLIIYINGNWKNDKKKVKKNNKKITKI